VTEEMKQRARKMGWAYTPACDLDLDGYCFTHQTWNMAYCANAEMNRAPPSPQGDRK
jgi:hypothetical protein